MANTIRVRAIGREDVPPLEMPERFRREVVYFMTPTDSPDAPKLGANEYWIETANIERWLEDGVFTVVSPLDAETVAEIELSEDQERWLEWMQSHGLSLIKLET
ncbi:MAG: hypothetical protein ACK553_00120 [Planctomycetota bacterium]